MKKSNSPIENYKRNMARMNNPPLPMKIFKVDFGFFEAYSDEFSSVIYDWEKTAQKSDLNNDMIFIYKGTYDVLEPYTTVSEEFHGPMVVKKN